MRPDLRRGVGVRHPLEGFRTQAFVRHEALFKGVGTRFGLRSFETYF